MGKLSRSDKTLKLSRNQIFISSCCIFIGGGGTHLPAEREWFRS